MHAELIRLGVDDAFVTAVPGLPTPVTFGEIFPPDHFPIWSYRYPKAPDLEIRADELPIEAIKSARLPWVTGTGLSAGPSRGARQAALDIRGHRAPGVPGLDYRPSFWPSLKAAGLPMRAILPQVKAVGNLDERETAVGTGIRTGIRTGRPITSRWCTLRPTPLIQAPDAGSAGICDGRKVSQCRNW